MTQKVAIITCYKDPNYIRARVLRAALGEIEDATPIVVKNKSKGFIKFLEVPLRVLWCRLKDRPDKYLITFRGYEMLFPVRILTIGKGLYFDEFINLEEWLVYEHNKIKAGSLPHRLIHTVYRIMLLTVSKILTDTDQHADYSANLMAIPREKYQSIPVGTDDGVFKPTPYKRSSSRPLEVFYYGSMLPLHGLSYVFEAAVSLKDLPIHFTIIGGDDNTEDDMKKYIKAGASIKYIRRVPFESLGTYIQASDICLGGPFGNTVQSQLVITGKTYQFLASNRATIIGTIIGESPFRDKKNILMVKQANAGELVKALKWALKNPKSIELIAKNGRELYERHYSLAKITEELRQII